MTDEQRQHIEVMREQARELESSLQKLGESAAEILGDDELDTFAAFLRGGRDQGDAYYDDGCESLSDALELILERGGRA